MCTLLVFTSPQSTSRRHPQTIRCAIDSSVTSFFRALYTEVTSHPLPEASCPKTQTNSGPLRRLGPVANTDTKLLIYGLFQKGRVLAQDDLGLVPKENSSGDIRRLGRITKRGDSYLRMLLTQGGRAVLRAANVSKSPPDKLRAWARKVHRSRGHNKAVIAVANKLAPDRLGRLHPRE